MRRFVAAARSLEGRAVAVLLLTVLAMHAGESLLYHRSATSLAEDAFARELGSRLAVARDALGRRPRDQRSEEARALSTTHFEIRWSSEAASLDATAEPTMQAIRDRILSFEPSLGPNFRLTLEKADDPLHAMDMVGSLPINDGGGVLVFRSAHAPDPDRHSLWKGLAFVVTALVGVSALALMHWIANPLRDLARMTSRIGQGEEISVPEIGPVETRAIAGALNAMQDRIRRLLGERTQALAAVSHDLRTPIARLRLRLDGPFDREQLASMSADLDDMQSMIDLTLAYLRGETDPEPRRIVNVASLAMSVADAFADTGRDVKFDGPSRALAQVRPTSVRRAFSNLVENAIRYGTKARLSLTLTESQVVLRIEDDGPGIPLKDMARALQPFVRLESSRNRDGGGTGLGLTIAHQAILADGGILSLSNLENGLRAEVSLPRYPPMP